MSALNNSALIGASGSTGYQISRSVRLRSSASAFFNRTFSSSGTDLKMWTLSFWMKRGRLGVQSIPFSSQDTPGTGASSLYFIIASNDTIGVFFPNTGATLSVGASAVLRDPSAWYHIVFAWDSTQATSTNRIKIYINGVQQTLAAGGTYPSLNATTSWNSNCAHFISKNPVASSDYFDGYFTEINSIDGQALTPSSFGQANSVTGVWEPRRYTGTYGTNGFYLNFSDPSAATATAIGKDYSGNGNNWTPNNISVTAGATYDSMIDVPTPWPDGGNGRGNYCVLNPLQISSVFTLSNANLTYSAAVSGFGQTRGTIYVASGKWYFEDTPTTVQTTGGVGILSDDTLLSAVTTGAIYTSSGNKYLNGAYSAYGASYAANDVIGVALDMDASPPTVTFYKNNSSQGSLNLTSGKSYAAVIYDDTNGAGMAGSINFGQRPFAYTPPSGFRALNTQNLPTPTIAKGNQYFDATLYTGNGSTQSITNAAAMQPDLIWIKSRNAVQNHVLTDSARGVGFPLWSNLTNAEGTGYTDQVTSFNSNGFSLGNNSTGIGGVNTNGNTYVAWQWKEGATQGFDIVLYTGNSTASRSINHSLGVTPSMIIVKNRSAVQNWPVAHTSLTVGNLLTLDTTQATAAAGTRLRLGNSTAFTVGDAADYGITNQTGQNYVAYCFAAIAGFSAFGSYTGNGSADGPFVFCGFRPAFVMVKSSSAVNNWNIYDDQRPTYNQSRQTLSPNLSNAESTTNLAIDLLSNGFKWREGGGQGNDNGQTYIFAAFSEVGFKYALGR